MDHFPRKLIFACLLVGLLWLGSVATAAAQSSPTHTVRPGETLSQIAASYGVPMSELMALNSIDDANAIYVGQILVLPSDDTAPAPEVAVDPAQPTPDATTTHIVRPGDTLTGIAAAYGLDPAELMSINGIDDPNTIFIGQKLRLTPILDTDLAQPEPTPEPHPANRIASLNRVITVAAGDSLDTLALRFGVDRDALIAINQLNTNVPLSLGQSLILPATAADLVVAVPAPDPAKPAADTDAYIVQPGDSLSAIAQAHGYSLAELLAANQIDNPDTVYVGQPLILPTPVVSTTIAPRSP